MENSGKSLHEREVADLLHMAARELIGTLTNLGDKAIIPEDLRALIDTATQFIGDDKRLLPPTAIEGHPEILQSVSRMVRVALYVGLVVGAGYKTALRINQTLLSVARATEAKRKDTQSIDNVIARHAGAVLQKHPRYTSHRIAASIHDPLNEELAAQGHRRLGRDAIRKRVDKYRTIARSSR